MSPRCFPLLVGTPGFMTQGKAGNQLGALRFSRGHFLQMMDVTCPRKTWTSPVFSKSLLQKHPPKNTSLFEVLFSSCHIFGSVSRFHRLFHEANMGAFLGEASKVPFILRRFQPHWSDRCQLGLLPATWM